MYNLPYPIVDRLSTQVMNAPRMSARVKVKKEDCKPGVKVFNKLSLERL
jgi:hypothetical protein